jgi:serine/threonine protein kinase
MPPGSGSATPNNRRGRKPSEPLNIADWPYHFDLAPHVTVRDVAGFPTMADAEIPVACWEVERLLGKGSNGRTYKVRKTEHLSKIVEPMWAKRVADVTTAAVKIMKMLPPEYSQAAASAGASSDEEKFHEKSSVDDELQKMSAVSYNPLFPTLYYSRFVKLGPKLYYALIFMEYCDARDLYHEIYRRNIPRAVATPVARFHVESVFAQLLLAIHSLHRIALVHRDIKPSNIMLTKRGLVKLGDFGHATLKEVRQTFVGTMEYMAPEVFVHDEPYTEKVDIWSFGVTMYELIGLARPYTSPEGKNIRNYAVTINSRTHNHMCIHDVVQHLARTRSPAWATEYSSELLETVEWMLTKDHNQRPSTHDLLSLPFSQRVIREFISEATVSHLYIHTPERMADPTLDAAYLARLQPAVKCVSKEEGEELIRFIEELQEEMQVDHHILPEIVHEAASTSADNIPQPKPAAPPETSQSQPPSHRARGLYRGTMPFHGSFSKSTEPAATPSLVVQGPNQSTSPGVEDLEADHASLALTTSVSAGMYFSNSVAVTSQRPDDHDDPLVPTTAAPHSAVLSPQPLTLPPRPPHHAASSFEPIPIRGSSLHASSAEQASAFMFVHPFPSRNPSPYGAVASRQQSPPAHGSGPSVAPLTSVAMEPVGLLDIEMLDEDSGSMPGEEQLVLMEEEKRQRQIDNEAREQLLNSLVQDHEVFLQTLEGTNRSLIEAQWQSAMNAFESDFEMVLSPPDSVEQPTLTLVVPGIPTVRSVLPSPELALLPVTTAGEAQEVPLELPTAHRSETRDGYEAAASSSAHRLASVDVEEPVPMRNSSSDRPSTGASTNRPSFNDFSPSPMRPDPALPDSAMLPDAFESHQSMDHPAMEDDDEIVFISAVPRPTNADVDTRHPAVPAASHPEMHQVDSGSIVLEKRETTLTPRGMTSTEAPDATNMHSSGDKPSVVEQRGKVCDTETVATDEEVDTVDHDTASLGASTIQGALIEAAAVESAHSRNGPSSRSGQSTAASPLHPPNGSRSMPTGSYSLTSPLMPASTSTVSTAVTTREQRQARARVQRRVVEAEEEAQRQALARILRDEHWSTFAVDAVQRHEALARAHVASMHANALAVLLCAHSAIIMQTLLRVPGETTTAELAHLPTITSSWAAIAEACAAHFRYFMHENVLLPFVVGNEELQRKAIRADEANASRALRARQQELQLLYPLEELDVDRLWQKVSQAPPVAMVPVPPPPREPVRDPAVAILHGRHAHARRHWSSPTPSQRLPRAPDRHRAGHAAPVLIRISWRSRAVSAKSAHPTVLRLVRRRGRAPCPLAARSAPCLRDAHVRPQILARIAPC